MAALSAAPSFRNGMYRAPSVYSVSLSFGEFAAMMFPFALHYFAYGRLTWDRLYGGFLSVCLLLAIFASGARGAYMAVLAPLPFPSTWRFGWHARFVSTRGASHPHLWPSSPPIAGAIIGDPVLGEGP